GSPMLALMDLATGKVRRVIEKFGGLVEAVPRVAVSPRGDLLAWVTRAGPRFQVKLLELDGGKPTVLCEDDEPMVQHGLNFDARGARRAVAGRTLRLFDVASRKLVGSLKIAGLPRIEDKNIYLATALSPDGKLFALAGAKEGEAILYDAPGFAAKKKLAG